MNTDRDDRQATAADVWNWRKDGCNRHEVATYLGIDTSVVRGMEREALAGFPVENVGIPVEQRA